MLIKSKLSPAGQNAEQISADALSAVQKAVSLYEQHTGTPIDPSSLHIEPLASPGNR